MRNCIAAAVLALSMSCTAPNAGSYAQRTVSQPVLNDVRLSLAGPETLPLPVALRDNPAYDARRNFFTVSLKNESGRSRVLPFDEMRRNVVLTYRNLATGAEKVDNRTPPPKLDGSVEALAAGETKTFQVVFEYPAAIATMTNRVASIRFCVKWDKKWLRQSAYAAGAYDWNESFELCRDIRITDQ